MPSPRRAPRSASGPNWAEEERPVVQAGQRVADGPLEHLALELLLARVGPDELDDDVGAELEPVAVLDADRGVLGEPPAVEEGAVGAAQVGQADLPLVVGPEEGVVARDAGVGELDRVVGRPAQPAPAGGEPEHRAGDAAAEDDQVRRVLGRRGRGGGLARGREQVAEVGGAVIVHGRSPGCVRLQIRGPGSAPDPAGGRGPADAPGVRLPANLGRRRGLSNRRPTFPESSPASPAACCARASASQKSASLR